LRWHHPRLGEVSPQEIVELAEENGRIARLTDYVLGTAIEESHAAIELDPRFTLSVNISALSLTDDLFLGSVARQIQRHRFPPKNLVLEVTETSPLDAGRTAKTLHGLRAMDINLSIDDFGTGHSNLDYLQRVPSSEIKIDRMFVNGMDQAPEKAAVVRATIAMAHALDRTVVAEGVETREVAEALYMMGCTRAQGYLYSCAIPMRQLLGLLHRGRLVA
jgi:EAL domain-containing protein (putative c-di-GMP-specific phosphodiesterase class I)